MSRTLQGSPVFQRRQISKQTISVELPGKPVDDPISPGNSKPLGVSPNPPSPHQKGPSLLGILASKRFARRFADRVAQKRAMGYFGDHKKQQEPTYRMEPVKKFETDKVKEAIQRVVEERLSGFEYSAKRCALMSRVLTEEIREKVKELRNERYKIVCMVTMGQKKGQGLRLGSRCVWDHNVDNHVTYNWQDENSFCSVTVFGVYHE